MNFTLNISGDVKQFASIIPDYVRFAGYATDKLGKTVRISPQKDNPFKILSVKPSHNEYVKCSLRSINSGSVTEYDVVVENIYGKVGSYNDTIIVKTTSAAMP
ncbi:MAG: DUF1573 domain-containing protein, partial [Desulfobacteraceae bacterium]|nr:DUF1573 domain-containing protein [Desulfobacteraceae bacterium]